MSGKFMKVKKIIIPTITLVLIASQLMGCAAASQDELLSMIDAGDSIEIEVATPAFAEAEQGEESSLLWEQLALLSTNPAMRKAWDSTLGITNTDTGKNGMLYVDVDGKNENIKPNTVCTSSWGMLFTSNKESETKAVEKYIKTKLFRFLVRSLSEDGVIAISPYRFSLVPDQDFTSSSDIDWEQSIDAINKQLYVKYSLSDSEIGYIENIIKPISNPTKTKITEQAILANYVNTQIKNLANQ